MIRTKTIEILWHLWLDKLLSTDDTDRDYHDVFDSQYFNVPEVCSNCASLTVCKFLEDPKIKEFLSKACTGCAFKPTIKKEA